MFTGIAAGTGRLAGRRSRGGGVTFTVTADFDLEHPQEGESIAVSGVCLTAYDIRGRSFCADVSPETLARSTLGSFAVGETVNLERALRLQDRVGGHLVSGHIDCCATVRSIRSEGEYTIFTFTLPGELSRYLIRKGSVAVDGISLTVNSCDADSFSVSIIPHTLRVTALGRLQAGGRVNLEVDLIGKYVEKLIGLDRTAAFQAGGVTAKLLLENGFL